MTDNLAEELDTAKAQEDTAEAAGTSIERREKTVFDLVRDTGPQFAVALGNNISQERFVRLALTALKTTPRLAECSQQSLLGALMLSAQLGLEPAGPLGQAYLVPFRNKGKLEAQFILGYKGKLALARRSPEVASVMAYEVFEADEFSWRLGLNPDIHHVPIDEDRTDPDKVTHVYAVCKFKDIGADPVFVVLTRAQIEKRRARSKAKDGGPWVSDWIPMALKTGIHALSPWMPMTIEARRAEAADGLVLDLNAVQSDSFMDVDSDETSGAGDADARVSADQGEADRPSAAEPAPEPLTVDELNAQGAEADAAFDTHRNQQELLDDAPDPPKGPRRTRGGN